MVEKSAPYPHWGVGKDYDQTGEVNRIRGRPPPSPPMCPPLKHLLYLPIQQVCYEWQTNKQVAVRGGGSKLTFHCLRVGRLKSKFWIWNCELTWMRIVNWEIGISIVNLRTSWLWNSSLFKCFNSFSFVLIMKFPLERFSW